MTFESLWPLLLLVTLPIVWLLAWRQRTGLGPGRVIAAALLRSAALGLVILALMAPSLQRGVRQVSVVYALDISRSVSPAFVESALRWIDAANERHRPAQARYVVFADRARLVGSTAAVRSVAVATAGASNPSGAAIDQAATDVEEALHAARFGFAPRHAKRLVLLSDGNATQGDLWPALNRLRAEGVRVYTVPAAVAAEHDAWIEALLVPADLRAREPVTVTVKLFSRTRARARVELRNGERTLASRSTILAAGETTVELETRLAREGRNDLAARVVAEGDQIAENDALTETVWVRPPAKVLYVESNPESAHYLSEALEQQGIGVRVAKVEEWTADPRMLAGMDAVILSDVAADSIDAMAAQRLERFVRDEGGGLIFAAGDNTYGKEGYARSEIERLLPVKFEARRKRKDLDLVLLIDRSHSMRGRKLELAKAASLGTLDLLEEQHRLAVIAFDAKPHEVVPLLAVGTKRRAEDLISGMTASGLTNIYPALRRAYDLLAESEAKTRHVILLSDGQTAAPPADAAHFSSSEAAQEVIRRVRADTVRQEGGVLPPVDDASAPSAGAFPALVAELAAAGVTLSTVAIGEKPNLALMADLAKWAEGKSYVAKSDAEIPGLFVAETRRLLGESIVEQPFRPTVNAAGASIAGVDFRSGPQLKGFVVGKAKEFSDVLLQAQGDQPLLAETRYGLGKTVVFLSDVKNRWAADWLQWPGYGRLWAQIVRDAIRRSDARALGLQVRREGNQAIVALRALNPDGSYRSSLSPRVRITVPDASTSVSPLRQLASGSYEVRVPLTASRAAPYRFELLSGAGLSEREVARAGTRSLFYPHSDEYRMLPPNVELLRALSARTGGTFAPKVEEIFAERGDGGYAPVSLWRYFTAAAVLCFLLELLVRRAPWHSVLRFSRGLSRRAHRGKPAIGVH